LYYDKIEHEWRRSGKVSDWGFGDQHKDHWKNAVNSNGISCRLGLVYTPLCICSSSTYCIIQGLLTRKSEIRNIFVGKLRANSSEENPPKRTQHILNIVSDDCLVGHMTK
jgi:hypothetical protein